VLCCISEYEVVGEKKMDVGFDEKRIEFSEKSLKSSVMRDRTWTDYKRLLHPTFSLPTSFQSARRAKWHFKKRKKRMIYGHGRVNV